MRITVIIPTFNEAATIGAVIESAISAGADQIIVSDSQSDDETPTIVERYDCELIQGDRGRGSQLVAGADAATGQVLVFLHADTILAEDCLAQIRELGETAIWGCFEHHIDASGRRFRWLEKGNRWRAKSRNMVYGDQAMWVTREAYQNAGGFPPVPIMEDVMMSKALKKIAAPIVLPGPVTIPDRHWRQKGVVLSTARNWLLVGLFRCGVSADRIEKIYRTF